LSVITITVLSIKKQIDANGEYFNIVLNLDDHLTRCFLRTELERRELLRKLHSLSSMEELYSIDKKAVLYIA
jgi:hypothetical protein